MGETSSTTAGRYTTAFVCIETTEPPAGMLTESVTVSPSSADSGGLIRELLLKRHRLYYTIQPMEERTVDENDVPGVSVRGQMTCTCKSVFLYITTDIEFVRVTCRRGYTRLRA